MTRARRKTKEEIRAEERAEALRAVYAAKYCVCADRRPKANRQPFCKADMGVLGEMSGPRTVLHGDLDAPETAEAWETCLEILKKEGYVKPGVQLL